MACRLDTLSACSNSTRWPIPQRRVPPLLVLRVNYVDLATHANGSLYLCRLEYARPSAAASASVDIRSDHRNTAGALLPVHRRTPAFRHHLHPLADRPHLATAGAGTGHGGRSAAGQSIRARQLIVEVGPGDVQPAKLSECQYAGAAEEICSGQLTETIVEILVSSLSTIRSIRLRRARQFAMCF